MFVLSFFGKADLCLVSDEEFMATITRIQLRSIALITCRSYTSSALQVYWPRNIQKLHKNSICLYKTSEILKKLELIPLKFILQH